MYRAGPKRFASEHTVLLKGLRPRIEHDEVEDFVRNATPNVLTIRLQDDNWPLDDRFPIFAYLNYEDKSQALKAKSALGQALQVAEVKGDPIFSPSLQVFLKAKPDHRRFPRSLIHESSESIGDPRSFFKSLRAHHKVEEMLIALNDEQCSNAILISGTGTGKTLGTAVLAALNGQRVFIVVPKVIQVYLLVDFLEQLFPDKIIGFAASKKVGYDLSGKYDVVVVTYGHLLRKMIGMIEKTGNIMLSDYLMVLDEVHESIGEIQAVMALATRIPNQKVVMSATLDIQVIKKFMRSLQYKIFQQEPESMHPVEVSYEPLENPGNRDEMVERICRLTKQHKETDSKILIFVSGISLIDRIIDTLIEREILEESEIAAAHSEMWEEDIFSAVKGAKVIVGTNILESSITVKGLNVIIDTVLKNEIVNNSVLREVYISQAEAVQRAGRVGRTGPGKVIRLITEDKYNRLEPYPTPPFELNDPYHIVLSMSTAFDFKDEIGSILMMDQQQLNRCVSELERVGAITQDGITEFGRKLNGIGMNLRYACPVAKVLLHPASSVEMKMLVLLLAVAFENFPNYVFILPRELRSGKTVEQKEYVKEHCCDLLGFSSIQTVLNIFVDVIFEGDNITDDEVNKASIKRWCSRKKLNSKYLVTSLVQLTSLCDNLFRKYLFQDLKSFPAMVALRRKIRPNLLNADGQDQIKMAVDDAIEFFKPYFPNRYVPQAETALHLDYASSFSTTIKVHHVKASHFEGYHIPKDSHCVGALVELHRKGFKQRTTISVIGIFQTDHAPILQAARAKGGMQYGVAIATLQLISQRSHKILVEWNAIELMVRAVRTGSDGHHRFHVRKHALAALRNVAKGDEDSKRAVIDHGALNVLVCMADSGKKRERAEAVAVLRGLSSGSDVIKTELLQAGVMQVLVRRSHSKQQHEKEIAEEAIKFFKSRNPEIQAAIAEQFRQAESFKFDEALESGCSSSELSSDSLYASDLPHFANRVKSTEVQNPLLSCYTPVSHDSLRSSSLMPPRFPCSSMQSSDLAGLRSNNRQDSSLRTIASSQGVKRPDWNEFEAVPWDIQSYGQQESRLQSVSWSQCANSPEIDESRAVPWDIEEFPGLASSNRCISIMTARMRLQSSTQSDYQQTLQEPERLACESGTPSERKSWLLTAMASNPLQVGREACSEVATAKKRLDPPKILVHQMYNKGRPSRRQADADDSDRVDSTSDDDYY